MDSQMVLENGILAASLQIIQEVDENPALLSNSDVRRAYEDAKSTVILYSSPGCLCIQ